MEITIPPIIECFHAACEHTDLLLVEGVGGLYAPLSDTLSQPDLIRELDIPVILVIGCRLGCLNHALLTAAALRQEGLELAGWIGNLVDPDFQAHDENIPDLETTTRRPLPRHPALRRRSQRQQACFALHPAAIMPT